MRAKIRKRYLEELARMRREVGEEGLSSDDEDIAWYDAYRSGIHCRTSHLRGGWFVQTHCGLAVNQRDGEYICISRGPIFGDFVTILIEGSMQDTMVARLQST